MTDPTHPTHLDPSELGTRAYWDSAYITERANFASNTDDEGTVWFSDAGAEERMVLFLSDLADEGHLYKEGSSPTRFLDLGTGNGHLLFELADDGWMGELVGVDYSAQSVGLARAILATKEDAATVSFYEWDVLEQATAETWLGAGFDVVLDKGTFDAICLSQEKDESGRRVCEGYREKVVRLLEKGGRFLITSCNWTAEELRGWFEVEGGALVYEDKVKYPSFTFGGKSGTSVCTLCFKRR